MKPRRYSLAIELTPFCNQRCGYCYNDWRDAPGSVSALPTATLIEAAMKTVDEVSFDHVTITGGEPFARPELFDLLDALKQRGLRALIISNGGLIGKEQAERLAMFNPLFVQVTLNGTDDAMHAAHVGGSGHFEATLAGVRALRAAGVVVAGCVVVTRKNARSVGEILDLWKELGASQIALSRYSPAGFAAEQVAELLPSRSDILEALRQSEARAAAGLPIQVTMPVPPCVVEHTDFPHIVFGGCPIGTEMQEFALGSDGGLRHCTLHTDVIGSVQTTSAADLVRHEKVAQYRDVTPAFCEPCPMKAECIGGCGAAAASVMGDPRGLDPFVGQHVDEQLGEGLRAHRESQRTFVPAGRLIRRKRPDQGTLQGESA